MIDGWEAALLFLVGAAVQVVLAGMVLLRPPHRQSSALAWILVILVLPMVGALAFLLFGDVRLGTKRRRRHRRIADVVRRSVAQHWAKTRPAEIPERLRPVAGLAGQVADTDPHGGNHVELIADTERLIEALVEDIGAAREHCHLLYYIFLDDESGERVGRALLAAAARRVTCRLLVDAVGSSRFLDSKLRADLERGGVVVREALPTRIRFNGSRVDLRNHRKIAVFDGRIGYTGSHNIAAASFAHKPRFAPWVDATVRVDGPTVRDLQELFVEDWYMDTDDSLEDLLAIHPTEHQTGIALQVLGTGPSSHNDALIQLIQAGCHLAREELILTTPYFVPDEGTVDALATAALRGVRTSLVVPHRNDSLLVGAASRSYYEPLLEAGVQIFEYTEGLLHAKTITVDRSAGLVTTANLDRRSFEINFEVSLMIYDTDFASQVRFLQRSYIEDSIAVDPAAWERRGWVRRIAQNAAGMLSPIL
ncbi:MAG: cardiolipin synthase [Planctomycetota bacterium]